MDNTTYVPARASGSGGDTVWGDITGTLSSQTDLKTELNYRVPKTTTVNAKELSTDIVLDKTDIGLANVDNTSDANKPVSADQQTALDNRVPKTTTVNAKELSDDIVLDKTDIGLANVDNTSDANKPVSTAQLTALNAKQDTLVSGTNIKTVNSTSLLGSGDIVISGGGGAVWGDITGTLSDQTDLKAVTDNKVDKVIGKGLSTNDYTDIDETKIGFISVTQAVDLDTMESDIATNNAKVGITAQQASDITTNNAKISFDTTASTKVSNISVTQAVDLDTMESDIATNTAKVTSISDVQTRTASFSTSTGNQYNKCNSETAINATLDPGIPIGSTLAFSQANVGEVTFIAGTSVTLEPTGKKLVEGSATAICIDTDTYRLDGNLEDV